MAKRVRCSYVCSGIDYLQQIKLQHFVDKDFIAETPSQVIKCHRHEAWQIWFIIEGNVQAEVNGTVMDGRPEDLFLIRGNDFHELWTKDGSGCHVVDIKFTFNPEFIGINPLELKSVRLREKSIVQRLIEKILFEVGDRKPGWELMLNLHLVELVARTLRRAYVDNQQLEQSKPSLDRTLYHHFVVSQVKAFIDSNYNRELSINILAEQVHLNPKYLSHIFKKVTGSPISHYLTETRLAKAKELLLDSHLSIKEIALEVGYTDTSYFDRVFKKIERVSPNDYRTRVLEE